MFCFTHRAFLMRRSALLWIAALAFPAWAGASGLSVLVLDKEGQPAADAVVVIVPSGQPVTPPRPLPADITITQDRMRFVPAISIAGVGARALFVNNDPWEHHVRASAAGVAQFNAAAGEGFELRLEGRAEGKPARTAAATFSKAGAVLLGCHIHASMRGHVYVSDSPWTLLSGADGVAAFDALPPGRAQVRVWHADQLIDLPPQIYTVTATPGKLTVQLGVVPRRRRL